VKHLVLPALLLGISSVVHAATVTAKVVALDEVIMYNRLGSNQPGGMIYALARDVVSKTNLNRTCDTLACNPGQVQLRPGKRPRPLVLRVNAGDDLVVTFTNLLESSLPSGAPAAETFTRRAGLHIQGVEWSSSSQDDGSFTDGNVTSYSVPGERRFRPARCTAGKHEDLQAARAGRRNVSSDFRGWAPRRHRRRPDVCWIVRGASRRTEKLQVVPQPGRQLRIETGPAGHHCRRDSRLFRWPITTRFMARTHVRIIN
jgi:hypothetical protein